MDPRKESGITIYDKCPQCAVLTPSTRRIWESVGWTCGSCGHIVSHADPQSAVGFWPPKLADRSV